jgi:hypothetical protein
MATGGKYGKVTTEHGDIPADEPVFVLRARDELACPMLSAYFELCRRGGSPQPHLRSVEQAYTRFAEWQEAHADQLHVPDSD